MATSLEVDLEWSSFFYTVRTWYAQDVSMVKSDTGATISSSRIGVDAFSKGSGYSIYGAQLSMAYLAFVANESISLGQSGEESFAIQVQIPDAGLGLSTSW